MPFRSKAVFDCLGLRPCWGPQKPKAAHGGADAGSPLGSPRGVLGHRLTSGGKAGDESDRGKGTAQMFP